MVDKLSGQVELIEVSSRRGRAATIAIGTITTGAAGTNASVTNVGTSGEAEFNFTIPRGDDVQLRIDSGYLQWKNTTASTWTNIVQITDITATIEVGTVTTGAAGTSVTFVNAGSGKDAIFNLSIPKGTTFTPSVSAEGVISFTNDGGLDNPTSVDIKGNPAPNTIFQYSVNNIDWTTTATGAQWYRQSGDNGATWSEAIAISTTAYADAKVAESITEDVTGVAPSQAVVFDALALKADASDVADALALKADADDVINALESAVDENIPIFDGVTGDKLKDSGVKLSDKADLTYVEYLMMEGDPA